MIIINVINNINNINIYIDIRYVSQKRENKTNFIKPIINENKGMKRLRMINLSRQTLIHRIFQ